MSEVIKVAVPAGIGDVSWIWSKLTTLKDKKFEVYTPDTYPQRTFYWLNLLGDRVIPRIGKHGYNDILTNEAIKEYANYDSWKRIQNSYDEGEVIYLQPNQWFLAGKDLKDWLPDLEVDYHYSIYLSSIEKEKAIKLLGEEELNIGIHMGCIQGGKAWNTWTSEDWTKLILEIVKDYPKARFVFLGGLWDLDMAMEVIGRLPSEVKFLDLIGKTNIAQAIAILELVRYYVGFSSGLNVMCNVLGKPCMALWPKYQRAHIYPHADPQDVEDRKYLGFVYDEPSKIYLRIKKVLSREIYKI